jgi:hypothetical protein
MIAMSRRPYRWLTLLMLVAWVILGPVGMAFESCAAMMLLCDGGPCGAISAVTDATPTLAPPMPLTAAVITTVVPFTPVVPSALEPPPKSVRLSA